MSCWELYDTSSSLYADAQNQSHDNKSVPLNSSPSKSSSTGTGGVGPTSAAVTLLSRLNHKDEPGELAEKIYELLNSTLFMTKLSDIVQEKMNELTITQNVVNLDECIRLVLKESGLKEVIMSLSTTYYERVMLSRTASGQTIWSHARTGDYESNPAVKAIRSQWEQGINEETQAIALEQKRPFARPFQGELSKHPLLNENVVVDKEETRFLFDSDDLLETMMKIKPSSDSSRSPPSIGLLRASVETPLIRDYAIKYPELHHAYMQTGIDDFVFPEVALKFTMNRHADLDAVGSAGNVLEARQCLRQGCSPSLRGKLWRVAFALPPEISSSEVAHFNSLVELSREVDFITDELYVLDVKTFCDDPRYFVFEDVLLSVALCFSRDATILEEALYLIHKPILGFLNFTTKTKTLTPRHASPLNGIQPFLGLATSFAPLCYIYPSPTAVYALTKMIYCKLWCKLNVISADEGCLLHLCKTFENFVLQSDLRLYLHLIRLGISPLQIVLPWLQLAFVNYLEPDQVLLLWDRVIGYMDTTLLAALAAAIFLFKSNLLLDCDEAAEATAILLEGSRLKVIPLLQFFLFADER